MTDLPQPRPHNRRDQSSEFGDEELALDDLEAVEHSAVTQSAELLPTTCSVGPNREDHARSPSNQQQQSVSGSADQPLLGDHGLDSALVEAVEQLHGAQEIGNDAAGEFDDDDFEDEVDDGEAMADVAAQYDTRSGHDGRARTDLQPNQELGGSGRCGKGIQIDNHVDADDENTAYKDDDDGEMWEAMVGDGGTGLVDRRQPLSGASQVRVAP